MSFWMWTIRNLISIARGTYNKFWTRRTSGSVSWRTIAWKCAYKNLTLHSGSPTHSVVTSVRSSAHNRSSRIDYWTLNSRNVNSVFAASGRFMRRRSHIFNAQLTSFSLSGLIMCTQRRTLYIHNCLCMWNSVMKGISRACRYSGGYLECSTLMVGLHHSNFILSS